jgi:UDP-3-O-[3-hydroxymyristoyl] glucosamine N-acyltransferase
MDATRPVRVTAATIAEWVQGRLVGQPDISITGLNPLPEAGPGDLSFLEDERHVKRLAESAASVVIVPDSLVISQCQATLIHVPNPLAAFIEAVQRLRGTPPAPGPGIHPTAQIAATAVLGEEVYVGPFVSIGEQVRIGARTRIYPGVVIGDRCTIGSDCILYPRVVLYHDTVVGNNVIIHAGAVIGSDGFGYRPGRSGHTKVPQLGRVEIGDDVEIGANTTIDRATFSATRIGRGTKIDNLVQIAHNCHIGAHNLLAAQVGIAGSSRTGAFVTIAGQAGIRDHIEIGEGAVVGAMAGVMASVPPGTRVAGIPAEPEQDARQIYAVLHRLPELRRQLRELTTRVAALENRLGKGASEPDTKVRTKRRAG